MTLHTGSVAIGSFNYDQNMLRGLTYSTLGQAKWDSLGEKAGFPTWGTSFGGTSSEFETVDLRYIYPAGTGEGTLEGKYASMSSYTTLMTSIPRFDFTKDLGVFFAQHDSGEHHTFQQATLGSASMTGAQLGNSPQGTTSDTW